MIKIRTKLLVYFIVVIVLASVIFFVRDMSMDKLMDLHNESSQQYYLLNQLTEQTDQVYQSLQIYVHEPTVDNLNYYEQDKVQLLSLQDQLDMENASLIDEQNYYHLLSTFLEFTDLTVIGVEREDIEQYSNSLSEADKTATYIHEKTLELLNQSLTNYQTRIEIENSKIQATKHLGTTIFIALLLVSILFAIWFSDGITRTIRRLTSAAKEISSGNYEGKDIQVSQKDELKILSTTFNEMKHNVKKSILEMEEKSRLAQLLKEMELKSLQNQINPHFLFNTLNVISKTAYIEGAERTNDLITAVSTLLRYNIGNIDRNTKLIDEVNVVKEYFFIQQTRFGDRVNFDITMDQDCSDVFIPCLTLQPLVENAFMHGIEQMEEGAEIRVVIYREDKVVTIEVIDNGVGMSDELIQQIIKPDLSTIEEEPKRSGHSTGIGLRNVIDRLHLFDARSKFQIYSTLNKGTTIQIQLHDEETRDVESNVSR
ncbi:sensor histidine kinase [Gracilibacillus marinus]|uniref:histidine kinase n=1 Tax=Gracilibacillus marinus TaxID=630535 RepID=A0ABV8VTZ5_9BACI